LEKAAGFPNDARPQRQTSGIRLGSSAITRSLGKKDTEQVATFIDRATRTKSGDAALSKIKSEIAGMCMRFPMPHLLGVSARSAGAPLARYHRRQKQRGSEKQRGSGPLISNSPVFIASYANFRIKWT